MNLACLREPADLQSWAVIVMAVDSLAGAERNLATAVERYVADQRDSLEFYGLQVPDKPPNVYYYDGRHVPAFHLPHPPMRSFRPSMARELASNGTRIGRRGGCL